MTPEEIMAKVGDQLSVRRVFGEPIERDGTVVIPVAVAVGGGGGGSGPAGQGEGGGFGGIVRGIGAYTIHDGQVRFIPAIDTVALAAILLLVARTLTHAVRRRRGRGCCGWGSGSPRACRRNCSPGRVAPTSIA